MKHNTSTFLPSFLGRLSPVLLFWASCVTAQVTLPEEYGRVVTSAEVVGSLGTDAFGEQVSLYTGSTEFTVTDIDLPGTGLIPVRLGRRYVVENRIDPNERSHYPFGDWQLDLPHLHGTFARSVGWTTLFGNRCTDIVQEPPTVSVDESTFGGNDYWYGNHLYAPDTGAQEMLVYNQTTNPNKPSIGGPYHWVTQGQWFFSCLPTLASANGYPGQGFLAIDPNGSKYWFNWMVPYRTQSLEKPLGMPPLSRAPDAPDPDDDDSVERRPGMGTLERDEVWIYPTRIEDRFGNAVTFTWSGGNLTQIEASDGRSITLTYADGVIASATDGTRTWTYGYDVNHESLESTQRPDGSAWGYLMHDLVWLHPYILNDQDICGTPLLQAHLQTPRSATITHPSGAVGTFTFLPTQHGRAGVPQICAGYLNQFGGLNYYTIHPRYFSSLALKTKVVSGPGLSPLTWQFDYGTANASWATECGTGCITSKTVTVTGPDEVTRHTFGTKYAENEGRLLQRTTGPNAATTLRTETLDYQAWSSALAYPYNVGASPMFRNDGMAGRNIPQKSSTLLQDGSTFSWSVASADFDAFVRPTRITRSGNATRVERTEYHDDTARWVLGQIKKRICQSTTAAGTGCTNTTVAETTFHPTTALPLTYSAYGQLQQALTWHGNGALHTVGDGNGHTTTFTDWYRGVPRHIRHPPTPESPSGAVQTAIVSPRGEITRITDEMGYATAYDYDPMGRISLITRPTGDSTAWTPTSRTFEKVNSAAFGIPAGHWRLTETTGAHSKETFFDALWRPILTRERDTGFGTTTRYVKRTFDAQGRETFASYPSTNHAPTTGTWTGYDALGRVKTIAQDSETGVLTASTEYLANFQTRNTNPRGFQTTTTFQTFDQPGYASPISLAEPGGVSTTISRDAYGKPLTITRSGSYSPPTGGTESLTLSRRFLYDAQQRLCKTIEPDAGIALFTYDAAGNLQWSSTGQNTLTSTTACQTGSVGASQRSVHHYDARNRLIAIDHPAQTDDVGFTYYADGALHTASTGTLSGTAPVTWSAKTSEWTYTLNKRRLLTGESLHLPPENKTFALTRSYTALGHEATLTYPNTAPGTALTVAFTPNALGQARQAGTYATTATYHPNGQIKDFTYGNAITRSLIQNTRGLPERILDQYASTKTLDHTLTYDENANLQSLADGIAGAQESRNLTYDARDRLAGISATPASGTYAETYAYDPLDRIRRITQPGKDWRYSYDASTFRLHEIRNPANVLQRSYQWNTRGEWDARITHTVGNPPIAPPTIFRNGFEQALISTTETFTFDRARRLVNANGITHRYDAHGRRVVTIEPMWGSKHQVYDQAGTLRYLEDSGNNERIDYIHLNGQLIAERSRPLNGTTAIPRYLHSDHRGSPSVKTASNRTVIYRSWHDAYGAPKDGLWRDGPGFTGHQMDPASQLIYMQQRYHDPETGFISTDPVGVNTTTGGNFNRYWYANNNPYRFVDPDGRYIESAWDAASLSVGIVSLGGNVWNGNWSAAAADVGGIALDTAALLIPVVPGGASVAIQASRAGSNIVEAGARGRASEARVLSEMGETKNTAVASTSQGRTIPDFQNATQVGEIKDTARLSDSSQLRAQREHAQATGREHVVVTGANTQVSGTVQNQSTVIRRDDLGPEGKR